MEDNKQNTPESQKVDDPPQVFGLEPSTDNPPVDVPDKVFANWSAKEFIEHKKSSQWYLIFVITVVVATTLVYLLAHSIFVALMIFLIGVAFGIAAGRHPKEIDYELNSFGIHIGKRDSSYSDFKSFSVIDEGDLGSISLNPLKRFVFPTTIYYDLKDEEKIVKALIEHLPLEEPDDDPIDRLMRRLRF